MKRLVGLSSQQLETREGVMEGLARNGLAAAVKAVTLNAELVTAATGPVPTISTTASGVTASLAPVELTAATNSWSAYVDAVLYPFLLETYMASAQQTYQFVNGTLHVATPEVIPLTAEDYLRAAVNRLKNVGALLWSSIRESLVQGYEAGETTHQLAARIRDVAKDISETRAITIARTEVISAANAASQAQVELGGFSDSECRKQWLATEDERTRATHRLADGQNVGLSESFFVGGEYLQFPGAPTGRADNVINCRCTVEYVFVEDGDLDNLQASGGWCAPTETIFAIADGSPLTAADVPGPGDLDWKGWNATNPAHPKDAKGKWTDTPDGIEQLPVWEKMTPEQIETWYSSISQADWEATAPDVKAKVQSHANLYYDIGGFAGPKNKVKLLDAGKGPAPAPPAASLKPLAVKTLTSKATPLHVNTNVIYKQKYADNAVVAVHPDIEGSVGRIIWSEPAKKFILQSRLDDGTWLTVEMYGKGEAYKKFSKETGWLTPDSTLPALSAPTATITPSGPTSGYFGKPILSSGDFKQAAWTEKVGWLKAADPDSFDTFSVYGLEKLEQQVHEMYLKGDLSGPDYQAAVNKIDAAKLKKTGGAPVPTPPIVVTPMKQVTPLEDFGWEKSFGGNAIKFDAWFAKNLTGKKDVWDQLSANDKKLVEAAAYNATMFGYDKPSVVISNWHDIDASGDLSAALVDKVKGMTNGEFAGWLAPNVDQTMWNGLAPETKDLMEQKANTLSAMGYSGPKNMVNVLKANDPAGASLFPTSAPPASVPPSFNVSVDDSDISGPDGTTPAKDLKGNTIAWVNYAKDGSGAFIYSVGPNGGQGNYVGSVDFEDGEVLEASISAFISTGAINPNVNIPGSPKPPPAVKTPPAPTVPSAPPPHGYNQHILANQTVAFVGDIGQPEVGVKSFKSISTAEMGKLQHEMLLLSDKKKWTPEEKNAVGFYSTKLGYQSMNAVLRNDEARFKLFSEQQLSDAVKSAGHVQSSMTPLTTSLELHRGTGAQQFGFKTKSVSTEKLKKLEGQTIVDRGFVSTSVVPPTAISYDYTKKPVKVIIKAPKGTPAVYVDGVKPGHGENELLLGAGTNFHVDEVREASAADKALYGDHTEQVVTLTVVPATKVGPKDLSSKATPSKSATVTTGAPPSLTPKPSPATLSAGGKPIKLNTNAIYKQTYANGAVVAVQNAPGPDGNTYRLVWHEPQKKFFLQLQQVDGAWINAANLSNFKFTKKAAFDKFKNDTNWVTPNPGDTALGTSGWPPNLSATVAPKKTIFGDVSDFLGKDELAQISTLNSASGSDIDALTPKEYSDVAAVAAALKSAGFMSQPEFDAFNAKGSVSGHVPALAKPVKAPKFDAAQLQAMHGVPPTLQQHQKNYLWQNFKYGGTPTTLHTQPATVFKKLHKAMEAHNKNYPGDKLNLLQTLKLIDERASQYSTLGNQNAYEKKILDWLQTPSGKATATKVIDPSSVAPKTPGTGSSDTVTGILFKVRDPSEIGTPHTKHATFHPISHNDAQTMQIGMEAAEPLTESQRHGVLAYTNNGDTGYEGINGVLRGKKTLDSSTNLTAARSAVKAQAGMRALPQDVLVYRKTGAAQFPNLTNSSGYADIKKFENKVFQDKGFLSTSIKKSTWTGNVQIEIEVPKGTPGIYTGGTWPDGRKRSNHANEMELILAAGLRYRVLKVEQGGGSVTRVRLRVEP